MFWKHFRTVVLNPPNALTLVVIPPTINLSLLLHSCNFTTVISHNVNICVFNWSYLANPCERII